MTRDLTVYFDGGCPLCRQEIAFWRRRRGSEAIDWVDLTGLPGESVRPGLSKQAALARFSVSTAQGQVLSGARAFAAMWAALPATRLLGRAAALPGVIHVLELAYRAFLKVRPLWRPHRCDDETCGI